MDDKDKDRVVVARRNRTKIREFKIQDSMAAKLSLIYSSRLLQVAQFARCG